MSGSLIVQRCSADRGGGAGVVVLESTFKAAMRLVLVRLGRDASARHDRHRNQRRELVNNLMRGD